MILLYIIYQKLVEIEIRVKYDKNDDGDENDDDQEEDKHGGVSEFCQ